VDAQPFALIKGKGTDIIGNSSLETRAKRKIITNKMVLCLVDVAKENGDLEAVQQYWNAYHCQRNITSFNHKLYGNYCKNRFCTICTAIRKAEIINKYYPIISEWEDPHFVTLTVKSCKADKLNRWVWGMFKAFDRIHTRCKKRHQRGKGIKLFGVKSLECNFNPINKTYNPHFHIIVPNKEMAILLRNEWMIQWRPKDRGVYRYKFTSPKAQHIKRVDDLEHTLVETIKYGSKIFTEPDLKKKSKVQKDRMIYAKALHNIFQAMKGKRLFDRFGFNLPLKQQSMTNSQWITSYQNWFYSLESGDWINEESNESLTGYLIPSELKALINECINKSVS
jgi:hypothetical protein